MGGARRRTEAEPRRDAIGDLRRQGRTIDEILAHLRTLGVADVSRTGLGEHIRKWDAMAKALNGSRAAAEAIIVLPPSVITLFGVAVWVSFWPPTKADIFQVEFCCHGESGPYV